jgi:hypothetical protein
MRWGRASWMPTRWRCGGLRLVLLVILLQCGAHSASAIEPRAVNIEVWSIAGPRNEIDSLYSAWNVAEAIDSQSEPGPDRLLPPPAVDPQLPRPPRAYATTTVETRVPVLYRVLDDQDVARLLARARDLKGIYRISNPRLMTMDRQSAAIDVGARRPFIIGLRPSTAQPMAEAPNRVDVQVRHVYEGPLLRCRPVVLDLDRVWMECEYELSNIRRVETTKLSQGAGRGPLVLETPEVQRTRVHAAVELLRGTTLLLGGLRWTGEKGKQEAMLITLRAEVLPEWPGAASASAK